MFAVPAMFLAIVTLLVLAMKPKLGILVLIITTPIIDVGWRTYGIVGMRPTDLMGVGVPSILLLRMIIFTADRPAKMIMSGTWSMYLAATVIGAFIMVAETSLTQGSTLLFRVLYGFVGFYAFQAYFSDRESFKKLLIVYMVGGIFPMAMGVYSGLTGDSLREGLYDEVFGAAGQARIAGLYHNSETLRVNAYMALSSILLYACYFSERFLAKVLVYLPYAISSLFVLFKIFSKATFASIGLGILIWTIPGKRFGWLVSIIATVFIVNIATDNLIFGEIAVTYTHEIAAIEGTGDIDRIGSSRFGAFKHLLESWKERDIFYQVFGTGNTWARHNDFFRALMTTGLVGLVAYLTLLSTLGYKLLSKFRRSHDPITTVGLIILVSWLIDAMGKSPSLYTGYQLWALGFIGLAIYGIKGLGDARNEISLGDDKAETPEVFGNIVRPPNQSNKKDD